MEKAGKLLKRLPHLEVVALREQWFLHFYGEAGSTMSARLLRLAIAYRVQELESDATARSEAIRQRARSYRVRSEDLGQGRTPDIKPGTRLLREYKGQLHEVLAIANGRFVYAGQIYRSLTEVATRIVGAHRIGTAFFGLSRRRRNA